MSPAEQVLRRVDRYQQQHAWVGVPFAVVKRRRQGRQPHHLVGL